MLQNGVVQHVEHNLPIKMCFKFCKNFMGEGFDSHVRKLAKLD